jgi:hypothetical protein
MDSHGQGLTLEDALIPKSPMETFFLAKEIAKHMPNVDVHPRAR